jgi:hypothetical protein
MRKALGGVVSLEVLRGCLVGCDERDLFDAVHLLDFALRVNARYCTTHVLA